MTPYWHSTRQKLPTWNEGADRLPNSLAALHPPCWAPSQPCPSWPQAGQSVPLSWLSWVAGGFLSTIKQGLAFVLEMKYCASLWSSPAQPSAKGEAQDSGGSIAICSLRSFPSALNSKHDLYGWNSSRSSLEFPSGEIKVAPVKSVVSTQERGNVVFSTHCPAQWGGMEQGEVIPEKLFSKKEP